jgi:membrane peptidoglycan carboxypeptidase
MGFPQEQFAMVPPRTPRRVTGGSFPAQIWQRFMSVALGDAPALGFHPPPPTTTTTVAGEPYLPPTPTTGAPFVLPDIRGHSAGDVFTLLSALGFRVSAVRGRLGATPGTVTAMSPPPGTAVGVGGRVTIEVAPDGAAPVTVPGVLGLDVDDATRVLRRAGLEAQAEIFANPDGPAPPGRVWAQAPAAGSQAALGSTVQLAVQPA